MGVPRPLVWDSGIALLYLANSAGAAVLSVVSVAFFQDREHGTEEIIAGTGFLVGVAWFISFVVAGFPVRRGGPAVTGQGTDPNNSDDPVSGMPELELEPSR